MGPRALRIMLVEDTPREVGLLRDALAESGFDVVIDAGSAWDLPGRVAGSNPDVIIIDTESPTRDVLEQVSVVSQDAPRPVVMFTDDPDNETMKTALRSGVSAYVVDGIAKERIQSILEVAIARFEVMQDLRNQLAEAQGRLEERKVVERAKGLLMERRGMSEEEAYRALRKLAMDRGSKLVEVARQLVEVSSLLG